MSEHPTRELAERIVNDLFGVGGAHEAHRLVLTGRDGRDMGGWGLLPMTDVVERHLRASSLAPVAPDRQRPDGYIDEPCGCVVDSVGDIQMPCEAHVHPLPKRDAREMCESLRIRAMALTGEKWERNATADMMKEAADLIESLAARDRVAPPSGAQKDDK